ncbi:BTB/POZ domain-containing protein [Nymphaea thermarum]|nr:BTB/POZ domain-containing protein [Nymphaea thermarum]
MLELDEYSMVWLTASDLRWLGSGASRSCTCVRTHTRVALTWVRQQNRNAEVDFSTEERISKSPVFKAMLENDMEESKSGTIKIVDVSYEVLRSFIHHLYTADALFDEQMAYELLVVAEKYQVKHLKAVCEKFITSKVNNDNAVMSFAFAHQHNAKHLMEAALSLIIDNMHMLTARDEYRELVDKDPRLVVEIYEAYLAKQVNTAAKD